MTRTSAVWSAAAVCALLFSYLVAFGVSGMPAFLSMAVLAGVMFAGIALAIRQPEDSTWLVRWVLIGFSVKAAGTWARHYMVTEFYRGGDSFRYYNVGTELSLQWRSGQVPDMTGVGSFGTQVTEAITGAFFALFTPDMLGGFLMFSIIAFFGQLLLYTAFRSWARPHQLKIYAGLIFLLPTFSFWPSSIGKDALVMFLLGGAVYFSAKMLKAFELRYVAGLAAFLAGLGMIRIHIVGLVVVGLVGAGLVAKLPKTATIGARLRRFVFLGASVLAGVLVLATVPDVLGVDLTGEESLEAFTTDVVRRTSEAGTIASGDPVSGIRDIHEGVLLVLFRPAIFESSEIQHLFAALETTAVAALTLWLSPTIIRNIRLWRGNGYLVFCTVYVLSYSVAFSFVRQLGIIARQRGQVLAMFLAIVIALGWKERDRDKDTHPAFREASSNGMRGTPTPQRVTLFDSLPARDPEEIATGSPIDILPTSSEQTMHLPRRSS